jgi:hypothetical protein
MIQRRSKLQQAFWQKRHQQTRLAHQKGGMGMGLQDPVNPALLQPQRIVHQTLLTYHQTLTLEDYQMQLMLLEQRLEQQNKNNLLSARAWLEQPVQDNRPEHPQDTIRPEDGPAKRSRQRYSIGSSDDIHPKRRKRWGS